MTDVAAFVVLWAVGWWLLWRVRLPPPAGAEAASRPPVGVVVPARDEADALPVLLASLRADLGEDDEVVVVDDHSTDATAAVAAAGGARVVPAPPLPPGWVGKAWACATGAAASRADVLVFVDADVRFEPGGLGRVVAGHRADGGSGLWSVQPWHAVRRPVERLAALFNVVAMMGTGAFTPGGDRGRAVAAFGPCLVTTRAEYERVGGHAAVASATVDDVALARAYRRAGLAVRVRGGRGAVAFRMYPEGLGQLVEGFTKNLALGARAAGPVVVVLVAGWLAACAAPVVLAAEAPLAGAAAYAAVAVQLHVHLRRIGSFGWPTAVLYLVPLVVFVAVFLRSLVATFVRRRVRWKGRDVPTR